MSTTLRVFGGLSKSTLHIPAQDKKNKGEYSSVFLPVHSSQYIRQFLIKKKFYLRR